VTNTLNPLIYGSVDGAGTLSFRDGSDQVTLTEFRDTIAPIYDVDRVGEFSLGANGNPDSVLEFSLRVTAVPEPASLIVLGGASVFLLGRIGRTRKTNR
jgi:hypothetical protein